MNSIIEAQEEFYNCLPQKERKQFETTVKWENVYCMPHKYRASHILFQILFEDRVLKGLNISILVE